eukprot:1154378-Pelagomonas_calceolata.AAC.3
MSKVPPDPAGHALLSMCLMRAATVNNCLLIPLGTSIGSCIRSKKIHTAQGSRCGGPAPHHSGKIQDCSSLGIICSRT